jgi:hypothetical protein
MARGFYRPHAIAAEPVGYFLQHLFSNLCLQRKEVRQQEQMYEGKKGVNINR